MRFLSVLKTYAFVVIFIAADTINARNEDTTKVHPLHEIVVSAHRIQAEIVPVQTLSGEKLEKLNVHSVADALRYFSGVQLKDYGGIGGLKTINVRGMGSQHVGVFYDGIEIGNPQNGVVDLGRYSLDNMEAISLYNGQKSALFQPAKDYASASSIYMTTKSPDFSEDKRYNIKAIFKTGAFDLANPSVLWDQKLSDRVSSSLNAEYIYSSGKYKFRHKVINTIDGRGGYDTTEVRKNGDIHVFRIEHALFGKIIGGEWKTRAYFYDSERGYPGAVTKNPGQYEHEDSQWDKNFFFQTSIKKNLNNYYTTLFSGKYAYDYIHYESDSLLHKLKNKYMLHEAYVSSAHLFEILPFWTADFSADFMWNKMNSNMDEFIYPQRYTGWIAGATSFSLTRLKIQAGLLGTYVRDKTLEEDFDTGRPGKEVKRSRHKWTPSLIISWQPLAHNTDLHLRAFYKNIFRMPTFSEMHLAYMGSLSSFLEPEYAKQYNAGVTYSKQIGFVQLESQVDAYYNKITDKLVAIPTSGQFRWTMMNLGEVKIRGVDVAIMLHARINKDFKVGARLNYTYQKAQDYTMEVESDTIKYKGQIPYIPRHSGSAIANMDYKTWSFNYSFIYSGERYTKSANISRNMIQEWYTHDLSVRKSFFISRNRCNVTMEVNNIFNQQYDVVLNYPMPGTNFKFIFNITI
jgi:outer membrane cobalamin receptor